MKRAMVLALALVVLLALGGCKRSAVADNFGQTLKEWTYRPERAGPHPITIKEYHDASFSQDLGVDVRSLPDPAKFTPHKFFVLEEWYGQIEFTTPANLSLNVRLARADEHRLIGTYAESHVFDEQVMEIDGLEVTVATAEKGCALVRWVRGDVQYVMHSNSRQGVPPMEDIEEMVTHLDSVLVDSAPADSSAWGVLNETAPSPARKRGPAAFFMACIPRATPRQQTEATHGLPFYRRAFF